MITVSKLKISGFKSFAFPSEIIINKGVTGIIGPNGCGKSNIFEAIRWVMGESSSKSLRSGSMDEVIFNGTEKIPAKNLAEVSLYLEKSDPKNTNSLEQITVSRLLERGVGSFYKINNKDVRAKDVLVLFSDTGSGPRSSSIIGQGNIDKIINCKPIERKIVLEEAAGTSGLQSRRHESELKLNATEANLERLSDNLNTLEVTEKSLNRQTRQAEKYQEISEKILEKESLLLSQEWKSLIDELSNIEIKNKELERQIKDQIKKTKFLDMENEKNEQDLKAENSLLVDLEKKLQLKFSERNILLSKKDSYSNRKNDIEYALEIIKKDIDIEKKNLKNFEDIINNIKNEIENFQDITRLKDQLDVHKTEEFRIQEKLKKYESELADEMQLLLGEEFKLGNIKESRNYLINKKEEIKNQVSTLRKEIFDLNKLLISNKKNILHKEKNNLENIIKKIEKNNSEIESKKKKINDSFMQNKTNFEKSLTESTKLKTEKNTLINLIEKLDLDEDSIFNLIKVKKGYETAVYSVLKEELSSNLQQFLKNKTDINKLTSVENTLKDFLSAPDQLKPILSQIKFFNSNETKVNEVNLKPGQMAVNEKGDIIRWDGFMMERQKEKMKWFQYKDRIGELKILIKKETNKLEKIEDENKKFESSLKEIDNRFDQNIKNLELNNKKIDDVSIKISNQDEIYTFNKNNIEKINEKILFLEKETSSLNVELDKIDKTELSTNKIFEKNISKSKLDTKSMINKIKVEITNKRRVISEFNEKILGMEINYKYLNNDLDQNLKYKKQSNEQTEKLKQRYAKYNLEKINLAKLPKDVDLKIKSLEFETKKVNIEIEAKNLTINEISKKNKLIKSTLYSNNKQINDLKADLIRSEEGIFHIKKKLEDLREIIFQRVKCQPEEIIEKYTNDNNESIEFLKTSLERLNFQREQMGPVNLRAHIEQKEISEKIKNLEMEKNDLVQAIQKLRIGINQINKEGKKKLLTAFELVNKNFSTLFKRLFEGGSAKLELISSDDPLETGIEIFARPPGKKLTSINLLSGGEKTLTAISLIFSIFLINPSPICILDEVDAALDDTNVEKFCDLMEEIKNSTKTRFLIISHHKTTMAMVDRIFGITMTQKGISDIVSVDFDSEIFRQAV